MVAAAASAEPIRVKEKDSGIVDSESDLEEEDGLTVGKDVQDLPIGGVSQRS